jgi:hypothetical protein
MEIGNGRDKVEAETVAGPRPRPLKPVEAPQNILGF